MMATSDGDHAVHATTPSRPVIFLDVDGVLHPLIVDMRDGKLQSEHCFKDSCMRILKRMVEESGAELVLSSSWRMFEGPKEKLSTALSEYGLSYKRM